MFGLDPGILGTTTWQVELTHRCVLRRLNSARKWNRLCRQVAQVLSQGRPNNPCLPSGCTAGDGDLGEQNRACKTDKGESGRDIMAATCD